MTAKHTPGPWYVTGSAPEGTVYGGPDHRLIVPDGRPENNQPEDWANRRLIAAAPEMLEELRNVRDFLREYIVAAQKGDIDTTKAPAPYVLEGRIHELLRKIEG